MQSLFDQFASPSGIFVFHMALALCAAAALFTSHRSANATLSPIQRRKFRALWVILAGQLLAAVVSLLAWQELISARLTLPPLERFILTLSIAWALWAWYQQGAHLILDTCLAAVHILALALLAATYLGWNPVYSDSFFINTWYHGFWELISLVIVLMGSGFILRKQPSGWISSIVFLAIQFTAIMADFLVHQPRQDYSAPLMIGQLASFPILFILAKPDGRAQQTAGSSRGQEAPGSAGSAMVHPVPRERRRYATDQKTFQSALNLAVETRAELLCTSLTRFTAHMLVSDLCFLIMAPDPSGEVIIEGGYDLIQEETWPGASLQATRIPHIASALAEAQPLRIEDGDEFSGDLHNLADVLGINETGNLMLVPLMHEVNGPQGGLILLSAYSQRVWSQADQDYLMAGTEQLTRVLQKQARPSFSGAASQAPGEDSIPPEYVREFFASLLDGEEQPAARSSQKQDAELLQAVELLRDENRRLLTALETARISNTTEESSPGHQQIRELEEALYYAHSRIEMLEKAEPARSAASYPTLAALIEAALVQASRLTGDKHVTMRVDIPSNLPPVQADPGTLKEVLVIALQKALHDTAAEGSIVLKAQAGVNPSGATHIHLKVISTGVSNAVLSGTASESGTEEILLQKARTLIAAQSGRLWLDPLAGGSVVTNLVVPAYLDPIGNAGQP